jgi:glycerol-3-phosphate acyltransferase PlsY
MLSSTFPSWWVLPVAYLIGAFPTAFIVAKQLRGIDIRQHGSGNVGASNVSRVVGAGAGRFVLMVDFFKGFLPVVAARWLFPNDAWLAVAVSVLLLIGHSKSVFIGFSGGKSAITGLGTVLALSPVVAIVVGAMAYMIITLTRTVSLGTLTAAVLTPLLMLAVGDALPIWMYGLTAALYVGWLHRSNIRRLRHGQENKI